MGKVVLGKVSQNSAKSFFNIISSLRRGFCCREKEELNSPFPKGKYNGIAVGIIRHITFKESHPACAAGVLTGWWESGGRKPKTEV